MKIALLLVLAWLAFGGEGKRLRALLLTMKKLPDHFRTAKSKGEDPAAAAKEVRSLRP